jgi:hypothetical protein
MAGRELYIYWKTSTPDAALAIVQVAQGTLAAVESGLQVAVLRREPADATPTTLMEIYRCPGNIDAAMQARIERTLVAATQGLVLGERHVEVFLRP